VSKFAQFSFFVCGGVFNFLLGIFLLLEKEVISGAFSFSFLLHLCNVLLPLDAEGQQPENLFSGSF
jgi:hypothetical protein